MMELKVVLTNEECEALERVLHPTERELVADMMHSRSTRSESSTADYALLSKVLRPVRQHITRNQLADAKDREERERAFARRASKRGKGQRR